MKSHALRRIVLEEMGIHDSARRKHYNIADLLDESFDLLNVRDHDLFPMSELYSPPTDAEIEDRAKQLATQLNKKSHKKISDVMPAAREKVMADIAREKAESDELDAENSAELNARVAGDEARLAAQEETETSPPAPADAPAGPTASNSLMNIITRGAEAERVRRLKGRRKGKAQTTPVSPADSSSPRDDAQGLTSTADVADDTDVDQGGAPGTGPADVDSQAGDSNPDDQTSSDDEGSLNVNNRAAIAAIDRMAGVRALPESRRFSLIKSLYF